MPALTRRKWAALQVVEDPIPAAKARNDGSSLRPMQPADATGAEKLYIFLPGGPPREFL